MASHVKSRIAGHFVDLYVFPYSAVLHVSGSTYQNGDPEDMREIVRESLARMTKCELIETLINFVETKQ